MTEYCKAQRQMTTCRWDLNCRLEGGLPEGRTLELGLEEGAGVRQVKEGKRSF